MAAAVLEIVELEDGNVALRRADGEGEPLVCIRFSDEAVAYLRDAHVDIARAMINTGIQIVGRMTEELVRDDDDGDGEENSAEDLMDADTVPDSSYLH